MITRRLLDDVAWTLYLVAQHPGVQVKLRQEIEATYQKTKSKCVLPPLFLRANRCEVGKSLAA